MSTLTYRKLVRPEDLNPAGTLFGGRIMQWADEAAALYVMCQLKTQRVVTLKVSEILFKWPVRSGDFLEFYAEVKGAGKSSITVDLKVNRKDVGESLEQLVLQCEFMFVKVDESGRPAPHGYDAHQRW